MAKKGTKKKDKKGKVAAKRRGPSEEPLVSAAGDLRTIDLHLAEWKKGNPRAAEALIAMGRDASFTVAKIARETEDAELQALGRRLAAVPAEVATNLYALRARSVEAIVERERSRAPLAVEAEIKVEGGAIGMFDPTVVEDALAKSGKPRRDPARIGRGDIACLGLDSREPFSVRFFHEPPPAGQPVLALRLRVESGLIYVGPPEASDGPRLGTVRLDPFSTELDAYRERGGFVRVKPGTYAVSFYLGEPRELRVHLFPEAPGAAPLAVDLAALSAPAMAMDAGEPDG